MTILTLLSVLNKRRDLSSSNNDCGHTNHFYQINNITPWKITRGNQGATTNYSPISILPHSSKDNWIYQPANEPLGTWNSVTKAGLGQIVTRRTYLHRKALRSRRTIANKQHIPALMTNGCGREYALSRQDKVLPAVDKSGQGNANYKTYAVGCKSISVA